MYKYQHRGTRLKKNLQCVSKAINVWRISLSSSLLISFGVIASMNWPRFKAEGKHINIAASVKFWQPFMSWVHANKSTLEHKLKNQFDACTNHDQTTHTNTCTYYWILALAYFWKQISCLKWSGNLKMGFIQKKG